IWTPPARRLAFDDLCSAELRLQSYLRPLRGARALRAMRDKSRAGSQSLLQRPSMVSDVVGFPSRRSEPVRHQVVVLAAASLVSSISSASAPQPGSVPT